MGVIPENVREIEKRDPTTNLNEMHTDTNRTPPIYYDSEPSSQPPKHSNHQPPSKSKHMSQRSTGAPLSTIAAVLGSEYVDLDAQRRAERKKKTLRERWNDFRDRNFGGYEKPENAAGAASAAEWNVQGARAGGGLASPYRRKGKGKEK
ncbi:hypothetical protein B5807_02451 [Epicoccum nigrum]|uniref:Uncharacterized protein n=1 Tax=Epicoccum nigrum TaxID=105696 RepID=A0A1Y2M902_EPING|nr:hypothetical protein B5807_02451 [Epicoccum nigrum]